MKKTILLKKHLVCLLLLFLLAFTLQGQTVLNNLTSPEKIYLQLDKEIYTAESTIWFKAIITNSQNNTPSNLSGVLYVEYFDSKKNLIEKKLIKLNNGIGEGFFDVPQNIPAGAYLIRAYTQWNKNFGDDFFFEKYIQIITTSNVKKQENAISNITKIKDENGDSRLTARLNPFTIDSLHKNKLPIYVTIDGKKDSLTLKKDNEDNYFLDYPLPTESQLATLEFVSSNNKKHSKSVVLNEEFLDLQFFPESGELVHGLPSKVGFKALNAHGLGTPVKGNIVTSDNEVLTTFESNALGMGSFILTQIDSSKTYYAQIFDKIENTENLYTLPKPAALGNTLAISEKDRIISIELASNYMKTDSVYLNISSKGASLYNLNATLKNGNIKFLVSANNLPEGIIVFKMIDSKNQVVAERLYFNKQLGKPLAIEISSNKTIYNKRELTNLEINTKNSSGNPVITNTSILVINKNQLGALQQKRDNILSYLLLSSELKGDIENPRFYFENNLDRSDDLEALMLTQGWSKYKYKKPTNMRKFYPEVSLNVSGHVTAAMSKNKRKEADITMMTFGKSKDIYMQTTDSLGNFQFNLFDEYGKDMGIVLQSAKKSGKKVNYNFFIDREKSPAISFDHKNTVVPLDSVADTFIKKEAERQFVYGDFSFDGDNIALDEVIIEAYKMTPNRKKVMDRFGEPDVVIDGDEIEEKVEKWSYGLYSVLMFSFSDKLIIDRDQDGNLYARAFNNEHTLVVIDGIPVHDYNSNFIQSLPPSEVSSVELIEYAKSFSSLYCEVYPGRCTGRDLPPTVGNVLAIYTHGQKGIYNVKSPVGILKTSIPVFSQTKEFYAPKYDASFTDDLQKHDLRALIHWQPILETNDSGKANISFYNADVTGEMMVVVEAITEDGSVAYKEFIYKVE